MARSVTTGSGYNAIVCDTVNPTAVTSSTTSVTILAANDSRAYACVDNNSTSVLYLLWGTGTASATNCTAKIAANGYYELPAGKYPFVGQLSGVWASVNGYANVTEVV